MNAFEIAYKNNMNPKWNGKYIDYSGAIALIKQVSNSINQPGTEIIIKEIIETNLDKIIIGNNWDEKGERNNEDMKMYSVNQSCNLTSVSELKQYYIDSPYGANLQDIALFLDNEIKKVYLFHLAQEKELFTMLNNHLIKENSYSSYNALQLASEVKKIHSMIKNTQALCDYLNWNMECLKQISEVCDSIFVQETQKTSFILVYLRTKIEMQNSDINYMFLYKLIDEISAVADYLSSKACKLIKNIRHIRTLNMKKIITSGNNTNINVIHPNSSNNSIILSNSIDNNPLSNSSLSDADQKLIDKFQDSIISEDDGNNKLDHIKSMIINYEQSIREYIDLIDNGNRYRVKYKNFQISIRYGFKAIQSNNFFSGIRLENGNELIYINCLMDEELVIKKFITPKSMKDYDKYCNRKVSKMNRTNFSLLYAYIFLYHFCHHFLFTNIVFESKKHFGKINLRLVLLLLGNFISYLFFGAILKRKKITKIGLLISLFSIFLGFILLLLFIYNIFEDFNFITNILASLFIGFGLSNTITSKYFIIYSYPPLLRKRIKNYHTTKDLGIVLGYSLGGIWLALDSTLFFKIAAIATCGLLVCLLALSAKLFIDPRDSTFHSNQSNTESIQSGISVSKRKRINSIERKMVSEANQVLCQENKSAQFSDSNMISKEIKKIIDNDIKKFSIRNIYPILSTVLFFIQFYPDYHFFFQVYYVDRYNYIICIACVVAYLTYFLIKNTIKKIKASRMILFILLIIQVIAGASLKFCKDDWQIYCKFGLIFVILINNLLIERICNRILVNCISQDHNCGMISGSLFLSFISILAKLIAYLMFPILKNVELRIIIDYFPVVTFGVPLIMVIIGFGSLKIKAIHRLKKKTFYLE